MGMCVLFCLALLQTLVVVCSYPNGAPMSICDTRIPVHGLNKPQTSPPPFEITLSTTTVQPGGVVGVRVTGIQGSTFRGIFLQVREVTRDTNEILPIPVGTYDRLIKNTKIRTCAVSMDTLTHKDPYSKETTIFDWTAPLLLKNNLVVRATIVTNFTTFWTKVDSPIIYLEGSGMSHIEDISGPWLKEIISTIKKQGNVRAIKAAVVSRFERGFSGAIDSDGHVIIHYVLDLLNFPNKYDTIMYTPSIEGAVSKTQSLNTNDVIQTNISGKHLGSSLPLDLGANPTTDTTSNKSFAHPRRITFAGESANDDKKLTSSKQKRYESLVKDLLAGERGPVVQELEDMIT